MTVTVKLADGTIAKIPNIHWHPSTVVNLEPGIEHQIPAGCYVLKSSIAKKVDSHNDYCDDISMPSLRWELDTFINDIQCAEIPFEILDDNSTDPWKNFGNRIREVGFGMDDSFWCSAE